MSESTVTPPDTPGDLARGGAAGRASDRIFNGLTLGAGILIFVVLALVTLYLIFQSLPAMTAAPSQLSSGTSFWAYVGPLVVGTLIAAFIALLVATPVAIGVALFISHYAPARISKTVGYVIDLLAAIPSVVYGAWGFTVFGPALVPGYKWLHEHLGFIPLFGTPSTTGRTLLTAALVLAVMILPIITSQCREIFLQTPSLHQEAALALGATKWDMIRASVFPFARNGIVSALMLGLGRALGETMAVTLVLSRGALTPNLIGAGNNTIPAEIALNFPEAYGMRQSELIAAGLVLFIITLLVNMIARWIVRHYAEFSGAN
ncbi:phosphate ABC transporter permease subunit PstC [Raineyella sp.]|uniref:phosphate ABC transporter permease subunit PstC n=1 Tax=Raineyella sp. TaxID=1911550 RepID=UPI002B216D12|nr:phosphate ABC transporter permease subunit PstC [Raineyella sp.]MEA5155157.1 phosphate ABC transporter permease subunit PstC [Raineyella sp.]